MSSKKGFLLTVSMLLLVSVGSKVLAHELHYTITEGEAVAVSVADASGARFSNRSYEVFRPGEGTPFAVGRTDELGRVVFSPDLDGEWRVRVFSEDGHGLDINVTVSDQGPVVDEPVTPSSRKTRVVLGVSIILAAFGLIGLLYGRRGRPTTGGTRKG